MIRVIQKRKSNDKKVFAMWKVYALLSAVFAALVAILAKIGITGIDSNLATAIRTVVILAIPT